MSNIPLFKVFVATDTILKDLRPVLESGYIGQGPVVDKFEQEFQKLIGSKRLPISVNSCTSALELALHLCGVGGKTKWVITTPQTCTATNTAIVSRGGLIHWADVDTFTGQISPESVAKAVQIYGRKKIAAIVAVDWGGAPCDYDALRAVAQGIPIIEDAAHSVLTQYNGDSIANTGGDYVAYSFQAIKHLTTGDGGALLVPPAEQKRAELLRWYGLDRKSNASFRCSQTIVEAGWKYHMNDIAATVGLANIPHVRRLVEMCQEHAKFYSEGGIKINQKVIYTPQYDPRSSYWIYTILVSDRDDFTAHMTKCGIDVSPVHARNDKHPCFPPRSKDPVDRKGIDFFAEHCVAIPCGWWLTPGQDIEIANCINEWSSK